MITYCTKCKEPCQAIIYDHGIGHYEYWGVTGYDTQLEVISLCCDASVIDENNNFIAVSDIKNYNMLNDQVI